MSEPPPVSRRRFLLGGSALAGGVLLGACGDEQGVRSTTPTSSARGLALVQFFGGLPMLAAGSEIRAPFGMADAGGLLPLEQTPGQLAVTVVAADGTVVADAIEVASRRAGLPRAYFPLRFEVDEPGIYTARTELEGDALEMAIKVDASDDVSVIQVGAVMPPIVTPTPLEPQGVEPICTSDPPCALHDETLADALTVGGPVAFLVATPAFCQTAICGPVLDILLSQVGAFPEVRFLHAEVYEEPAESLDVQTPAITELGLTFEPCLVLVGADGTVAERLDTIFDETELADALGRLG